MNNGLTKGILFLTSGNIHRSYNSKSCEVVRGAIHRLPLSAGLFLAGFFAITGSPPFSPFISEFTIINSAFSQQRFGVASLFLVFLAIIFIGMASTVLPVVFGEAPHEVEETKYRDRLLTVLSPLILISLVLTLGVWMPEPLREILSAGASLLEVKR
jgi:hydrogenase-4 component F